MKDYYSLNAQDYIKTTLNCDLSEQYKLFFKYLSNPKTILDIGFGSGRDSLYFKNLGIDVYSIDPSKEFCEEAKKLGLNNIFNIKAQDLDFKDKFDGIWACASLLHIPSNELNEVLKKCSNALHTNGIMYVSFKYGDFEGTRDERYYLDLNENSFPQYLKDTGFAIEEMIISADMRNRADTRWLNVILKKA